MPCDDDKAVGGMRISKRNFHRIHDRAHQAEEEIRKSRLDGLETEKLFLLYDHLREAEILNGMDEDIGFLHDYSEAIQAVRKEIIQRK